jgi:hypothetical protein
MGPPEQAELLQQAIANYRSVQTLLRTWEMQTERVMDVRYPRKR